MPLSDEQRDEISKLIYLAKAVEPERAYRGIGNEGAHDLLARNLEVQLEILDVLQEIKRTMKK